MPEIAVVSRLRRRAPISRPLAIGSFLLSIFAAISLCGPAIAPYDPTAQDLLALLAPPSLAHWFGTDELGRDILSRVLVGTRITMMIALVPVLLAGIAGVALGLVSGYFAGVLDRILTGFADLLMTIPGMVLAIAIVAIVGANAVGLIVAITLSSIPPLARLIRGRVRELREEDYVSAAISVGMSRARVLLRHVLPNAASVILIQLSLLAGQAVLIASALGFLGLGVQPPAPEWGAMLGTGRQYIEVAPHVIVAPGIAIALLVLAFNMLGDGLRDRFDPNLMR
ncbi:MAG: ABC transporter permease [Acetobacteraceae bacterium]